MAKRSSGKRPLKFLEKMHHKMSKNFDKLARIIRKRGGKPASAPSGA